MLKLTEEQANAFKSKHGKEMSLYSSFTHTEGVGHLSSHWTHIETAYSIGFIIFNIRTIQETKDSERKIDYWIEVNKDYFEELE